jgi:hypothetical protein
MTEDRRPNQHYLAAVAELDAIDRRGPGHMTIKALSIGVGAVHALLYIGNKLDKLGYEMRVDHELRLKQANRG